MSRASDPDPDFDPLPIQARWSGLFLSDRPPRAVDLGASIVSMTRREKLTFVAAIPVAVLIVAAIELLGLDGTAAWILAISISIALGAIGFRDDFRSNRPVSRPGEHER